jgi:hypothetical protein
VGSKPSRTGPLAVVKIIQAKIQAVFKLLVRKTAFAGAISASASASRAVSAVWLLASMRAVYSKPFQGLVLLPGAPGA